MSVKMQTTCAWTERPNDASLWKAKEEEKAPFRGFKPSVRYHSGKTRTLALCQDLQATGQSQASQRVTEACKGFLGLDRYLPSSAKAEGSLTARPTCRAGTKVGLSDLMVPSGRAVAQRIKVWHLDVGSSPPGAVGCSKGWVVRPLKQYVSWVQNVVRQLGPYSAWALEHRGLFSSTRGLGRMHLWCTSYRSYGKRWIAKCGADTYRKHLK
ncbi:hypothetical protein Cgig2_030334 [Carnegiea gigantea]|uniref:Uncharacterized protein n=1 Tax=Carnegiea gigantea TaxID=171969 RepID=A0A9Q1JLZ3_9CARY|nr:hypothetical protein Cgig2_030334 [Carnegiea gigantea]